MCDCSECSLDQWRCTDSSTHDLQSPGKRVKNVPLGSLRNAEISWKTRRTSSLRMPLCRYQRHSFSVGFISAAYELLLAVVKTFTLAPRLHMRILHSLTLLPSVATRVISWCHCHRPFPNMTTETTVSQALAHLTV